MHCKKVDYKQVPLQNMNPLLNEYQYTLNIKPEYYPDWNLMNPYAIQNEASVIALAAINILAVVYSITIEMI